ncbi:hypothetical protein [Endozoicomonas sp. GU-1]|uniref:hypothetical protein n=1 Tax=Endozoicomonas sp. GU-1 TaxID=3009078 RepID=UPI0022B45F3E|nr:hypothetical protein [Endozoicomonas sp. GU-1]WBA81061.1 hypothetical protein O2T12_22630 [Endozoicomonas sp. GU-1]WBA88624.1 hypothetical protein O3276_11805 [Endozoicomonas sp. GU-1]
MDVSCSTAKSFFCPPGTEEPYKLSVITCAAVGAIGGGFGACSSVVKTAGYPFGYFCLGAFGGGAAGAGAGLAVMGGVVTCCHLAQREIALQSSIEPKVITQQPGSPLIISHAPEVTVVPTEIQGEDGSTNIETVL